MEINGDKATMIIVKTALIRALNSLDHEIAANTSAVAIADNVSFINKMKAKRELLNQSREEMTELYNMMDRVIENANPTN